MNYYLARDGQTYGPYPQETFPSMLQLGQVMPQDLVCPEGGSDWVELGKIPALTGAAPPPAVLIAGPALAAPVVASSNATAGSSPATPMALAPNPLRISGTSGVSSSPHPASPPVLAAPTESYPRQKTGLIEKAAGTWGVLKLVGYAAVAIFIGVSLIAGYVVSQREKREIAKLQTQPGWKAFDAGNNQINAETSTEGFGNNGEAQRLSKTLATATETMQRMSFEIEKTPRYRGRSKLGLVVSAVDAATAGKGHFQTYVELRDDRVIVLVHVPEFSRYKDDARQSMTELCWESANLVLGEGLKAQEPKPAPVKAPATRTPTGRAQPGRARAAKSQPAQATVAKAETKPLKERTLVVGVRGKNDYECVFVGKFNPIVDAAAPTPIQKNVPSHQTLVKWFGEQMPAAE